MIVGCDLLRHIVLDVSFPGDKLRRCSPQGAGRLPDRLIVRHVAAGRPAERAGIAVGDEIVAIDDRPIDDDFPRPGECQGYRAAGTDLNLELAGGRRVRLVLKDYF